MPVRPIAVAALPVLLLASPLNADQYFWDTQGSGPAWSHGGHWTGGAGFPDYSDDTVVITGEALHEPVLDFTYQVGSLTMQNGGDLSTGDGMFENYQLIVTSVEGFNGLAYIRDEGTVLTVYRGTGINDFDADDLLIRYGAEVHLVGGGWIQVDDYLFINNSSLEGEGRVELTRNDGTNNPNNDGVIRATGGELRFFGHPDTVFDLDGTQEDGNFEIWNDATLIFDVPVGDAFDGIATIWDGAELQVNSSSWSIGAGGLLSFSAGEDDQAAVVSGSDLVINGNLYIANGTARFEVPSLGIAGDATLDPGTTLEVVNAGWIDQNASFEGDGQVLVGEGASLNVEEGAVIAVALHNDGLVTIADDAGSFASAGAFAQGPTGRIEFAACSSAAEAYDHLQVTGTVTLDGELHLAAIQDCEPNPGDEITIMTAGSVVGQFAQVTGIPNANVIYDATSVRVVFATPCAEDLTGDGNVNVGDLLQLLSAWGGPGGDVTGDGTTNVADLLAVLQAWGPCT